MPPAQLAFCSKCEVQHERPVGTRCTVSVEGSNEVEGESTESADSGPSSDAFQGLLLAKLDAMSDRLNEMDQRIQKAEKGTSHSELCKSTRSNPSGRSNTELEREDSEVSDRASVVPSLGYLRSNPELQKQVSARLREVQEVPEVSGNFKSQRSNNSNITVKKQVDWPQNYVLGGPNKKRVSFDDLSCPQFVAGFIRSVQLKTDETEKENMLEYLASLMEDASDFSFDSAKACHAVLLTSMEADRCSWLDSDKLERCRRAHAQRHIVIDSNAQGKSKNSKPCQYFENNTCFQQSSHWTKGVYYRHACQKCGANHHVSKCIQKTKN